MSLVHVFTYDTYLQYIYMYTEERERERERERCTVLVGFKEI